MWIVAMRGGIECSHPSGLELSDQSRKRSQPLRQAALRHAGLRGRRSQKGFSYVLLHSASVEVLRPRSLQRFAFSLLSSHPQPISLSKTSISAAMRVSRSASTISWVFDWSGFLFSPSLIDSTAQVVLSALDAMGQPIVDEEKRTKSTRGVPYNWAESFRFGSGSMGLEVLAGIRVQIVQMPNRVVGEGLLPLDQVFARLDKDGYLRHVVHIKTNTGEEGVGTVGEWDVDAVPHDEGAHDDRDGGVSVG